MPGPPPRGRDLCDFPRTVAPAAAILALRGRRGETTIFWLLSLIGIVLLLAGLGLLAAGRRTRLQNVAGNVIGGDVKGTATQTYTAAPPAAASSSGIGRKELIGWLIAIPGAALAAWNLWRALAGG
jgi:hypothetical protein